ncbi:hypothetical protein MHK_009389 [Candidatus Magnetomorum sp. HK-1]|nr:hypothetical protein MHK_009389 [Candidatus Magnetomorum sp. HK-1]
MKKKEKISDDVLADTVDCLGNFNSADNFCLRHCSLKLRCAIEQSQIKQMEMLEDIIYENDSFQIHL